MTFLAKEGRISAWRVIFSFAYGKYFFSNFFPYFCVISWSSNDALVIFFFPQNIVQTCNVKIKNLLQYLSITDDSNWIWLVQFNLVFLAIRFDSVLANIIFSLFSFAIFQTGPTDAHPCLYSHGLIISLSACTHSNTIYLAIINFKLSFATNSCFLCHDIYFEFIEWWKTQIYFL